MICNGRWQAFSVGDANFVAESLRGVSSIWQADLHAALAVVAGLIGFVIYGIKTMSDGKFELHKVLVGAVMFLAFFAPTTTVEVQDPYAGAAYNCGNNGIVIQDVPLGIAAAYSLVSGVGFNVAQYMWAAFSINTGNIFQNGSYLDTLENLLSIRSVGIKQSNSERNRPPLQQGDVEKSVKNYINECVFYGAQRNVLNLDDIANANDPWLAMRVQRNWLVDIHIPGFVEANGISCDAAWTAINNYIQVNGTFMTSFVANELATLSGEDFPLVSTQNALTAVGLAAGQAQQLMLNTLIDKLYDEAKLERVSNSSSVQKTIIEVSAIEQHNVQMSAEGTVWSRYARPLMAFVEIFVIGIAPFMAFIVMLGPIGFSMIGKYMMMLIWIVLWPSVLSLSHLYCELSMRRALEEQQLDNANNFLTMNNLDFFYNSAADWVAVGGMLVAATPALTLMLTYGSSMAATHLAGRLRPNDTINEKVAAPDISTPAPVVAGQNWGMGGQLGYQTAGAQNIDRQISTASLLSKSHSMQRQAISEYGQQYSSAQSAALKTSNGITFSAKESQALSQKVSSSGSQVDSVLDRRMSESGIDKVISESQANSLKTLTAGSMTMGVGGEWKFGDTWAGRLMSGIVGADGGVKLNADARAALEQAGITDQKTQDSVAEKYAQAFSHESGFRKEFATARQHDQTKGVSGEYRHAHDVALGEGVTDARTAQERAVESYSQDIADRSSFSASSSGGVVATTQELYRQGNGSDLSNKIDKLYQQALGTSAGGMLEGARLAYEGRFNGAFRNSDPNINRDAAKLAALADYAPEQAEEAWQYMHGTSTRESNIPLNADELAVAQADTDFDTMRNSGESLRTEASNILSTNQNGKSFGNQIENIENTVSSQRVYINQQATDSTSVNQDSIEQSKALQAEKEHVINNFDSNQDSLDSATRNLQNPANVSLTGAMGTLIKQGTQTAEQIFGKSSTVDTINSLTDVLFGRQTTEQDRKDQLQNVSEELGLSQSQMRGYVNRVADESGIGRDSDEVKVANKRIEALDYKSN